MATKKKTALPDDWLTSALLRDGPIYLRKHYPRLRDDEDIVSTAVAATAQSLTKRDERAAFFAYFYKRLDGLAKRAVKRAVKREAQAAGQAPPASSEPRASLLTGRSKEELRAIAAAVEDFFAYVSQTILGLMAGADWREKLASHLYVMLRSGYLESCAAHATAKRVDTAADFPTIVRVPEDGDDFIASLVAHARALRAGPWVESVEALEPYDRGLPGEGRPTADPYERRHSGATEDERGAWSAMHRRHVPLRAHHLRGNLARRLGLCALALCGLTGSEVNWLLKNQRAREATAEARERKKIAASLGVPISPKPIGKTPKSKRKTHRPKRRRSADS